MAMWSSTGGQERIQRDLTGMLENGFTHHQRNDAAGVRLDGIPLLTN